MHDVNDVNDNPYRAPQLRGEISLPAEPLQFSQSRDTRNAGPTGIGGWLILVTISLVLTGLRVTLTLVRDVMPVFAEPTWQALTTPGSEHYHALWKPLAFMELIGNCILVAAALGLLVLLVLRSRWFPRLFIAYALWAVTLVTTDFFMANQIPMVNESGDAMEGLGELTRSLTYACIWIPYMLVSKRVRNTFRPHVGVAVR